MMPYGTVHGMSVPEPPVTPGATPRPVRTREDVLAVAAEPLQQQETDAPIRDAIADAALALILAHCEAAEYAAAQSDVGRATDIFLEALAADHGLISGEGEDQEAFRARLFSFGQVVTETAIAAGVDAILSQVTSTRCALVDGVLDRGFLLEGLTTIVAYLGDGPTYPDRLLEDDAPQNGGVFRPSSAVGGFRLFDDALGRTLLVRVPDLEFVDDDPAVVFDGTATEASADGGFFVGDGTDAANGVFVGSLSVTADSVYAAILNFLVAACGQSVRWSLIADIPEAA